MRLRFPPWQWIAGLAAVCGLALAAYTLLRPRALTVPQLIACLPNANASLVYIDVDAMRRSGVLKMFSASKAAEEPDYQRFVGDTQFDYSRDLDAVAASFQDGHVYLALRGRFHWKNLRDYAAHQGGSCHNGLCVLAGSQPDRRISFYPLQSNVMALAVSPDDFAAYQIKRETGKLALAPPQQPLWAVIPASALKNTSLVPAGAQPYLTALENAEQIVFSVGPEADHLQLVLHVTCKDAAAASALLIEFEGATSLLRKGILEQHQLPNPADLSGLLVAGSFRRDQQQVYGQWPISRALVDAIAGSY